MQTGFPPFFPQLGGSSPRAPPLEYVLVQFQTTVCSVVRYSIHIFFVLAGLNAFLEDRLADADLDPAAPPFDELRRFEYEGDGMSPASSLESLASSGDTDVDWDATLNAWGPRFQNLAGLYRGSGGPDD